MALNNSTDGVVAQRREAVAELLLRRFTQRQIAIALSQEPYNITNPETGEPYTATTINTDIKALKSEWRKRANLNASVWLAEELAGLEQLEKDAWAARDYAVVLRIKERRSKLLGLDAPEKRELTGKDGDPIKVSLTWRAIVEAARQESQADDNLG